MPPCVAVIMSVYKSDNLEYVKLAVNSILNQHYDNLTLFIWRDGPVQSDMDDFLSELANEPRCIVNLSSVNNGLAHSLNMMIEQVVNHGGYDYIARMDSDDISYPDRIAKQVAFFENDKYVDVLGTNCREFGADFALNEKALPQTHDELVDFSIVRCPFIHPTVMFRSRIFTDKSVRYPTNTALTEDMALWFLLLTKGFKFSNLDEILLDYRLNEATLSRRRGWAKSLSEVKIRLHHMHVLRRYSFKNISAILVRLVFHTMPLSLVRLAYRYAR
ncbi:glycosyltransferase [Aeromonas caviae]